MKPTDEFKFGKYKGQTLEQVASIEDGRGWCRWYCAQPSTNPKFAHMDKQRKGSIEKYINEIDGTNLPKVNPNILETTNILAKLDTIETKIDILLAKSTAVHAVSTQIIDAPKTEEETWDE